MGRTPGSPPNDPVFTDHPHAGGENFRSRRRMLPSNGPSPRGWGELFFLRPQPLYRRTIPTRVGRTIRFSPHPLGFADHPHAGGENKKKQQRRKLHSGPSPRGWGERRGWKLTRISSRTIPTRVGRTQRNQARQRQISDHPHAGGENYGCVRQSLQATGPSPRGWGERGGNRIDGEYIRTIPTRVGRTDTLKECR